MELPPQDGARSASRPARAGTGELVAKLEQVSHAKPPPPAGKGIALAVLGVLAVAGAIHTLVAGGPVSRRMAETRTPEPPPTTFAPTPGPAAEPAAPAAPAEPEPASARAPARGETVEAASATELALAVKRAPPDHRAELRLVALRAFAELTAQPAHRRVGLEAALRLANEATPDESAHWSRVTAAAIEALHAPADAGMALLYLAALHDRGGAAGLAALERVVDDESRPLEQRTAAARALPEAARVPLLARIGSRPGAHPELLRALR